MGSKYSKEVLEEAISHCNSMRQLLLYLGLKYSGGSHCHLKKCIIRENIDISHFLGQGRNKGISPINKRSKKQFIDEVLIVNGPILKNVYIKKKLLEFNLKEEMCEYCKVGPIWNEKPITLELHHINGYSNDNRLENLMFLCPNCHSQTYNFSLGTSRIQRQKTKRIGKFIKTCKNCNISFNAIRDDQQYCSMDCVYKSRERVGVDSDYLKDLLWKIPTTEIAKQFNVSNKSIEKWAKKYGLSKPPPGYWQKIRAQ